jgi:hypothetical protein
MSKYEFVSGEYKGETAKIVIKVEGVECSGTGVAGTEANAMTQAVINATGLYIRLDDFQNTVTSPISSVKISVKEKPSDKEESFEGSGSTIGEAFVDALNAKIFKKTVEAHLV